MLKQRKWQRIVGLTLMSSGLLALLMVGACVAKPAKHLFKPQGGFIPDAATAIRVGEAVLMPIYGEEKIKSERPFVATLSKGVWTVEGSLPPGWHGGVAIVEMNRKDARILRVSHGK